MTEQNAPTARTGRPRRRGTTILAATAAALVAASCGTGDGGDDGEGAAATETTAAAEAGATGTSAAQEGAAGPAPFATADLADPAGEGRGTVRFAEGDGGTLVTVEATGLEPGFHGLHVHTTGLCEPDSANPKDPAERGAFLSAGGHLAGPDGGAGHPEHAGDLPPLYVAGDGTAQLTTLTDRLDRALLLDEDGSAVMIHENSDNLANIPERYAPEGPDEDTRNAGDGGGRAACGVIAEQR